jgi:hypothetical protein
MSKPWSKVSRLTFHRREIRAAKKPDLKLVKAWNFFTAMARAAQETHPGSTKRAIDDVTKTLIEQGEALAARVPAERLERGGARR